MLAVALVAIGTGVQGSPGLIGSLIGLTFGLANAAVLAMAVLFIGKAFRAPEGSTTLGCFGAFLLTLKVPLYAGGFLVMNSLGDAPLACFLLGVGLVYSVAVGWALGTT